MNNKINSEERKIYIHPEWLKIHNCTCEHCPDNKNCPFAFDEYNLNGDCLAEK